MKKLFYLVVALCFIQVGISKAQSSVSTDKQKKETISTQTTSDVKQVSGTCDSKKSTTTSNTCTPSKENPTCCQKKGMTTGCSGTSSTTSSMTKNDKKKVEVQKDASNTQNLGTTPK